MIHVTIYDPSPIVVWGLADLIAGQAEFTLLEAFLTAHDAPSRSTDLFVLNPEVGSANPVRELVARLTRRAPVLLFGRPGTDPRTLESLLTAGSRGLVETTATPVALFEAMRGAASGAMVRQRGVDAGRVPPPTCSLPALSRREQQVLDLIARGMTHQQIANAIKISSHTVDTYVKRIRSKLNLGNKADLTRVAVLRSIPFATNV